MKWDDEMGRVECGRNRVKRESRETEDAGKTGKFEKNRGNRVNEENQKKQNKRGLRANREKGSIEITEKRDDEMGRVECGCNRDNGRNRVKRENRDEGRMQRQQKNVTMEAFWRER